MSCSIYDLDLADLHDKELRHHRCQFTTESIVCQDSWKGSYLLLVRYCEEQLFPDHFSMETWNCGGSGAISEKRSRCLPAIYHGKCGGKALRVDFLKSDEMNTLPPVSGEFD